MTRSSLLLALVAACAGSSSPPAEGSGSSASGCPDAEIAKRGDTSLAASLRYIGLLEKVGTGWSGDCEAARIQFLALGDGRNLGEIQQIAHRHTLRPRFQTGVVADGEVPHRVRLCRTRREK